MARFFRMCNVYGILQKPVYLFCECNSVRRVAKSTVSALLKTLDKACGVHNKRRSGRTRYTTSEFSADGVLDYSEKYRTTID